MSDSSADDSSLTIGEIADLAGYRPRDDAALLREAFDDLGVMTRRSLVDTVVKFAPRLVYVIRFQCNGCGAFLGRVWRYEGVRERRQRGRTCPCPGRPILPTRAALDKEIRRLTNTGRRVGHVRVRRSIS